MNKTCY